jgi:hypothetical protein
MKFLFSLFLLFTYHKNFSQEIDFKTVKISQWTLEKFPATYIKKAATVYTEKDKYTGKLRYYEERNSVGLPEGLRVIMQKNLQFPSTIEYSIKGVIVYRANYFGSSNVAFEIRNMNLKEQFNGPQVRRERSYNSDKYEETITNYKNGVGGEDLQAASDIEMKFNKDSLLEGDFFMPIQQYGEWRYISGYAENGIVKEIKFAHDSENKEYDLYTKQGDSAKKESQYKGDTILTTIWKDKMTNLRKITNSFLLKTDPNYFFYKNGQPAFRIDLLFEDMMLKPTEERNYENLFQ